MLSKVFQKKRHLVFQLFKKTKKKFYRFLKTTSVKTVKNSSFFILIKSYDFENIYLNFFENTLVLKSLMIIEYIYFFYGKKSKTTNYTF